jgi:signal transduction histidine kinase
MPFVSVVGGDAVLNFDTFLVNFSISAVPLILVSVLSWVGGAVQRMQMSTSRYAHSAQIAELEYQRAAEQLVVEQERSQIARDMHDVVAHSLAVVVAQADGGRYLMRSSPQAVEPVLATISETARDALVDVRGLLSQLRHTQAETERKTLDDLPPLVARIRAAGLNLQTTVIGERRPLGANAEVAIYRLVQESLTNALKYGDGRYPTQLVSKWSDHYEITVRNRIAKKPKFQSGSRHGIVGMRERLAVVGGTVTASAQGDTWVVHASLPFVDRSRAAATPGLPHKQNESESSTS